MDDLRLKFDPMTIEHLGLKMYSHLPNAVAELVANAYDADATKVTVLISPDGSSLVVADNGHGMSLQELQENYLVIGRNRRASTGSDFSESGRRRVAGRKGLGKLAVFGIGNRIVVETKRAGADTSSKVTMVWSDIKTSHGSEYRPEVEQLRVDRDASFTRVWIGELNRKTEIKAKDLAASMARLFNYMDDDFELVVQRGAEAIHINRDLRYSSISMEAEWTVPDDFTSQLEGNLAGSVTGRIYASVRPLPAHLRGVTLYVRGRMANEPEFFGVPESSHAYSYITGYIDADKLDEVADVISTDRRAVSWDQPDTERLLGYLASVVREAAQKRRSIRETVNKRRVSKKVGTDIDAWTDSIKGPESAAVSKVLESLVSPDSDIDEADRDAIIDGIREIAPEYADLHWRALHPSIQEAAEQAYRSENYHHAVVEAIKRYVKDVRREAGKGVDVAELSVLEAAFNINSPIIDVVSPYGALNLSADTRMNMRKGHKLLSEAMWTGFRNPLQHEVVLELKNSGAFTYQDCLDALSILSHLRRRVEAASSAQIENAAS